MLRDAARPDDELYFILGEDALADLPNWHDPEGIADAGDDRRGAA